MINLLSQLDFLLFTSLFLSAIIALIFFFKRLYQKSTIMKSKAYSKSEHISVTTDIEKDIKGEENRSVSKKSPPQPSTDIKKNHTGNRTILLMDDEVVIRTVAEKLLSRLNYKVTTVSNGEDAILAYTETLKNSTKFDIVILDLTISFGMGGKETIKRLLEIDPEVIALVSSGYSNDPVMAGFVNYGFKGVIPKPYSLKELNNTIQTLIG